MSDPFTVLTRALSERKIYDVFQVVDIEESGKVVLSGEENGNPQLYVHPACKYGIFPMHDTNHVSSFHVLNIGTKHLVGNIPNFNPKKVGDVLEMLRTLEEQHMCDIEGCSIPVGQILGICGNLCRFHATMQPICCIDECMNKASNEGGACVDHGIIFL
jgi:hypothetical protein